MRDFINDYTVFIALGILFILLAIVLLFRRKKKLDVEQKKAIKDNSFRDNQPKQTVTKDDNIEQANVLDNAQAIDVSSTEPKEPLEQKMDIKKDSPNKATHTVLNENSSEEDDPKKDKIEKGRPLKYHVSQNKDQTSPHYKKWRVRKEGSDKTIKYYNTQKKAIEVAEDLAEKAGSSIVIHKVDGKIRKQDYWKKK
ncbi:MAG TPA: hypothetical protein DEA45_01340 [Acholeplasmataceae bacterium]|nr:hypothetical protein [Acholeplasmataceae bacterium]